jgi:hypothetical protein
VAALDEATGEIVHRSKTRQHPFDQRGEPFLADFGIKLSQCRNLTGNAIVGTLAYMSPNRAERTGYRWTQ